MKSIMLEKALQVPTPVGGETALRRFVSRTLGWLMPASVGDELPSKPRSPEEIAALEKHIRRCTEEQRFTGFPC